MVKNRISSAFTALFVLFVGNLLVPTRRSLARWFCVSMISSLVIHLLGSSGFVLASDSTDGRDTGEKQCVNLLTGQYVCGDPDIDPETQQARGCTKEFPEVSVTCTVAPGVVCDGLSENKTFQKKVSCKWTNGRSFETALLLSVFLGMFGVDRFYLGYPAIGLVKFATLGFMFLGQLIDILLIATQVLTPADGSAYIVDYYGAATERIVKNNQTYLKPGGVIVL